MTRREREKLRHREEIIDVAETLFFEKGYEGTIMEDIAKKSEYSRRTLYAYFKSKEDIYIAVYVRFTKIKLDMIKAGMDQCQTGYEKLWAFGEQYYQFFNLYPQFLRFQLYMDMTGSFDNIQAELVEEFSRLNQIGYSYVINAIEQGKKDGTIIKKFNPDSFIVSMYYSLRSILNVCIRLEGIQNVFVQKKSTPTIFYQEYLERFLGSVKKKTNRITPIPVEQ